MIEDKYMWKITLSDDTVKEETKDKFNLDWECENKVKKIELIGERELSVNLESGEFNINGSISTPLGSNGTKSLFFRKRRTVKLGDKVLQEVQTEFIIGYKVNNKTFLASIRPKTDICTEQINDCKLVN